MRHASEDRELPSESSRLFRAILLGTLAPSLLIVAPLIALLERPSDLAGIFLIFLFGLMYSAIGVLFIGIVAHVALVSAQMTSYFHYAFVGMISGVGLGAVLTLLGANPDFARMISNSALWAVLCVTSAVAFRFGWGRELART